MGHCDEHRRYETWSELVQQAVAAVGEEAEAASAQSQRKYTYLYASIQQGQHTEDCGHTHLWSRTMYASVRSSRHRHRCHMQIATHSSTRAPRYSTPSLSECLPPDRYGSIVCPKEERCEPSCANQCAVDLAAIAVDNKRRLAVKWYRYLCLMAKMINRGAMSPSAMCIAENGLR
jgi:hypothetical protein